ncbi:MAG: sulfide/dihydroorotate dehydrogenase-like FAD/NAD-binding protein [Clostridiales bacterium]|nr:sulfide/dihydroorotate dehydrogenase-like FAD/NAD-binding protein [Clostridiales bacterium]
MYPIIRKAVLNPTVTRMDLYAPHIAAKAEPGQFVILRVDERGERIPLTIADTDRERGLVTIIFQIVGAATELLNAKQAGDSIPDLAGPLGRPTETDGIRRAAVIGGGVGCAIAWPVAKKLHEQGACVHSVIGFRSSDLLILEDEFAAVSDRLIVMTDDGSAGRKGLVTHALQSLLDEGNEYDLVITIGPLIMMKFVSELTRKNGVPTLASMNSIMIDGTGMCGCCRLTVGGKTRFACVDGPDFDGHQIDFEEAMARNSMYQAFERNAHAHVCRLLKL